MRVPFLTQNTHTHQINIFACAPYVAAPAAFLDKTTGAVGTDSAVIVAVNGEEYFMQIAETETVIENEFHRFPAIPFAPIILVADGDAEFSTTVRLAEAVQHHLTDKFAVGFNGEMCPVTSTFCRFLVKIGLQAFERLGNGR